jgi:hypothetical protein
MPRNAIRSFRVRPRFSHVIAGLAPTEAHAHILQIVQQSADPLEIKTFEGMIGLHIPENERHRWSPRLFLNFEPAPEGATRIEGIYGPEIEVWSIFLYGYMLTGLLGTFATILGGAQLVVKTHPWGFWIAGAMALGAVLLYLGAQLGQKLGVWQTFRLHQAYENAIAGLTVTR